MGEISTLQIKNSSINEKKLKQTNKNDRIIEISKLKIETRDIMYALVAITKQRKCLNNKINNKSN